MYHLTAKKDSSSIYKEAILFRCSSVYIYLVTGLYWVISCGLCLSFLIISLAFRLSQRIIYLQEKISQLRMLKYWLLWIHLQVQSITCMSLESLSIIPTRRRVHSEFLQGYWYSNTDNDWNYFLLTQIMLSFQEK